MSVVVRRVLHVDPDEVAALRRVPHDPLEIGLAELVREVQAEPGELDADVRVELLPSIASKTSWYARTMPSASRRLLISSPSTSIVAIFPWAFSSLTTRTTSGMAVPAMYRSEISDDALLHHRQDANDGTIGEGQGAAI